MTTGTPPSFCTLTIVPRSNLRPTTSLFAVPAAVVATDRGVARAVTVGVVVTVTTESGPVEDPPPQPPSRVTAQARQSPVMARGTIARAVEAPVHLRDKPTAMIDMARFILSFSVAEGPQEVAESTPSRQRCGRRSGAQALQVCRGVASCQITRWDLAADPEPQQRTSLVQELVVGQGVHGHMRSQVTGPIGNGQHLASLSEACLLYTSPSPRDRTR